MLPTQPWRGQQSGVRELDLVTTPRGLRLRQRTAAEFGSLVDPIPWVQVLKQPAAQAAAFLAAAAPSSRQLKVRLVVQTLGLKSPIGLELFKGAVESVQVEIGRAHV